MPKVLDEITSASPTSLNNLFLMHTANGEDFLSILEERKIRATECKVFAPQKIAYFFLGRPAYKTSVVPDPSYWQLPAVFILKNYPSAKPLRIFPFDSGAMADHRYEPIIGKIKLDDFELSSELEAVQKAVSYFFGNQESYRASNPISYQEISQRIGERVSAYSTLALSKLYNHPFNETIDDRVKLVEFQFDEDIDLSNGNLKAVIICREWMRDPKIQQMISEFECRVKTYPIYPLRSSDYYAKIYELSAELCNE